MFFHIELPAPGRLPSNPGDLSRPGDGLLKVGEEGSVLQITNNLRRDFRMIFFEDEQVIKDSISWSDVSCCCAGQCAPENLL